MKIFKKFSLVKFTSTLLIVALLTILVGPGLAQAAQVTSFSVLLSREKASTAANQTITFTVPAAISSGETLILTYDNSTSIDASLTFTDIDLADDGTDVTLAAAPSGATWGVVRTSSTVITFTNGTTAVAASSVVTIEIGTHATNQSTGVFQITNGSAGSTTLVLSGTMGAPDMTGTAAMSIIADDQVVITATVAPTITFTVGDNTTEFGTLSSSAARWADNSAGSATDVAAFDLTVATNATGGYIVSYNGATLTSPQSDTITVASLTDDADGVQGSESFGQSIATNGDATITSGYAYAGTPDWKWVASTTTTIISETGPTATETFSMHYLANIAATTEAGDYTTTVTYIATGTF